MLDTNCVTFIKPVRNTIEDVGGISIDAECNSICRGGSLIVKVVIINKCLKHKPVYVG